MKSLTGLIGALADKVTAILYDLPSHGRSDDWDGTGDLHDVATDMGRGLLTEPMDLIGHSFGATIALRLAIEHPEMVRSVTMIEPVYFAPAIADHPDEMFTALGVNEEFNAAWAAGDRETATRCFNRAWGDGTKWADFSPRARSYMTDRIHFVVGSAPFLEEDSAGLLKNDMFARATMPALLIKGSTSNAAAGYINEAIVRRLPDATSAIIEGAGHMAPLTHPEQVADVIRGFLDSLEE
jgi:pimeloyl-ACP methyl ester carboxylesterase